MIQPSQEVLEKLGIHIKGSKFHFKQVYFTGWKELPDEFKEVWGSGWCGQLLYWFKPINQRRVLWVNLPGMQVGNSVEGSVFDIGTERVNESLTEERQEELLAEGMNKLQTLIDLYIAPVVELNTTLPSEG